MVDDSCFVNLERRNIQSARLLESLSRKALTEPNGSTASVMHIPADFSRRIQKRFVVTTSPVKEVTLTWLQWCLVIRVTTRL